VCVCVCVYSNLLSQVHATLSSTISLRSMRTAYSSMRTHSSIKNMKRYICICMYVCVCACVCIYIYT
jgi:hypothetical protein